MDDEVDQVGVTRLLLLQQTGAQGAEHIVLVMAPPKDRALVARKGLQQRAGRRGSGRYRRGFEELRGMANAAVRLHHMVAELEDDDFVGCVPPEIGESAPWPFQSR